MSKTNYVLIHGQLVEVSDDVLMHWKYIKKEKKNGRWVYYYKDDLDRYKESADKKSDQAFKDSALMYTRESIYKNAAKKARQGGALTSELLDASRKYDAAKYKYETSSKAARAAQKKYNKIKITTFAERTISKGAVKVANFFSKLFSKKK